LWLNAVSSLWRRRYVGAALPERPELEDMLLGGYWWSKHLRVAKCGPFESNRRTSPAHARDYHDDADVRILKCPGLRSNATFATARAGTTQPMETGSSRRSAGIPEFFAGPALTRCRA